MSLSESTVNPCEYNPITRTEYNMAVQHWGWLRRDGKHEEAAQAELAAKEIRRRLEAGK
jgi:hypothetical protein